MRALNAPIMTAVTLGADQTSTVIYSHQMFYASAQAVVTGSNAAGNIQLQGSNDIPVGKPEAFIPTNWSTLGTAVTIAGVNIYLIPKMDICYNYIRSKFITTSPDTTEVQKLTFSAVPDAGTVVLSFQGNITSLDYSQAAVLAATLQTNLRTFTGYSAVTVTGDYTAGLTITYVGFVGNVLEVTVSSNTLTLMSVPVTCTPSTLTPGFANNGVMSMNIQTLGD